MTGGFFTAVARLLYTRAGFDLGTGAGLALGGGKGGHAEGQSYKGCGCCYDDFSAFHWYFLL
jgi:hypothetical protein